MQNKTAKHVTDLLYHNIPFILKYTSLQCLYYPASLACGVWCGDLGLGFNTTS